MLFLQFARSTGALAVHCSAHRIHLLVCAGLAQLPIVKVLNDVCMMVNVPEFKKHMMKCRKRAYDCGDTNDVRNLHIVPVCFY